MWPRPHNALKLSVVVPAFNEERLLPATLKQLAAGIEVFQRRGWSSELIVCDNNSSDGTAAVARAAGAKVVFEPVNQIARARNAGARAARGEWLVFVDADSAPPTELLEEVRRCMERSDCVGGGTTLACDSNVKFVRQWIMVWNAVSRLMGWAAGSFMFCHARTFREAGGFSQALYAAEEIDLSQRLKRLGRFVILHRHPLMTSGRKAELYSWREHAAFLLGTLLTGGRNLRRRDACSIWYDGRR
jgi:glycosyltransferase involved in cell wall biosynthesis